MNKIPPSQRFKVLDGLDVAASGRLSMFGLEQKSWVDDEFRGQVLWSRRSGGELLCRDNGSGKDIPGLVKASVLCGMWKG